MSKLIEFIAYKGDAFTIEWYFDECDHSEALEYYNQLSAHERIQLLKLFKRMGMLEKSMIKQNFGLKEIRYMPLNPNPIAFYVFSMKAKKLL